MVRPHLSATSLPTPVCRHENRRWTIRRSGFTGRLARVAANHPWRIIGCWVAVIVVALLLSGGLTDVLVDEGGTTVKTEADRADDLINLAFGGEEAAQEFVLVEAEGSKAGEAPFDQKVEQLVSELRQVGTVDAVVSYLDGAPGLTSQNGTVALVPVTLIEESEDQEVTDLAAPVIDLVEAADAEPDFRVSTVGEGSINAEFKTLSEETLLKGETLGIPIALVILVLVFGTAVAAGVPMVLGIVSILVALGLTVIVGQVYQLSFFVTNMITMIGMAVGIDYSLFVVQRFREERSKGQSVRDAVERAGDSATRAVFFSGMTVVIALFGLLYMPDSIMRSLGIGAILAVFTSVIAALTLLPAVLGLLGDRVNKLQVPLIGRRTFREGGGRFWHQVTALVTARPVVSMVLAGGLLLAAASPFLTLRIGSNFIESLPDDSNVVHAMSVINREFESGVVKTKIVIDSSPNEVIEAGIAALTGSLESDPDYGEVTSTVSPDSSIVVVEVVNKIDPSTKEAGRAVAKLRSETIPAAFGNTDTEVLVTGNAAANRDYVRVINSRTPLIFVFVLGLSFILLMMVFRSIVVPLKAIIMNLLSVGATYGLLVLVFQHGVGSGFFGFVQTDVIEAWIPLFLFTVLFGLSMDYHIFLLSRIKERYDVTRDNDGSVAFGLGSTGAIITGAALIMVAVFSGFAAGDLVMFQQMGFGLAIAVILDATIVRSVLVPATMKLLGDSNWYFPRWLQWLPEIHVEGHP